MGWINRSIQTGVFVPGECDILILDRNRLTVQLCHEADIHVQTTDPGVVREPVERWLRMGYRLMLTDDVSAVRKSWREIRSLAEITPR